MRADGRTTATTAMMSLLSRGSGLGSSHPPVLVVLRYFWDHIWALLGPHHAEKMEDASVIGMTESFCLLRSSASMIEGMDAMEVMKAEVVETSLAEEEEVVDGSQ